MSYAIYLRKSRADAEAEARGEGETLARHERALKELAMRNDYPIAQIYREIVSGESISNRPQMRQLLADVAAGKYKGVLVMEVERLARPVPSVDVYPRHFAADVCCICGMGGA